MGRVGGQCGVVAAIFLGEGGIDERAPQAGRPRDELQVGRHEGDDAHRSQVGRVADRSSVDGVALAQPARTAGQAAGKAHLSGCEPGFSTQAGSARAVAHDLALARGSKGLADAEQRDRFEQIALPLRVRAGQDVEPRGRRELERRIVAHVGERQASQ